ncbi:hypothetical protein F0562_028182 [Nyssa sinensis]|uniref:Uncharacterized protein n=1 Tax=Nyssa sinensis TaxID=561372 RepID=A0A5J5B7R0_9ASTE|nr:hypothetical protein F0562_028182 [Nyssa sinensis]
MGDRSSKSKKTKKKKHLEDSTLSASSLSSSPVSSDNDESSRKRHKRSRHRHRDERRRSDGSSRREKDKRERKKRDRERKHRKDRSRRSRREGKKNVSDSESDGESGSSSDDDNSETARSRVEPKDVLRDILKQFPGVASDLEQLLRMIDDGQAVDIKGLSERSLVKHLMKLLRSLNLKENGDQVFLLPSNVRPTLEVVGPIIRSHLELQQQQLDRLGSSNDIQSISLDAECRQEVDDNNSAIPFSEEDAAGPRRRMIGPEMPSAELLAAAAKLTEAEAELREAELDEDSEVFIGPPPPAVVTEAESANEAERFEEVTRIMEAEVDSLYDVLGVNRNMSADNIKKR